MKKKCGYCDYFLHYSYSLDEYNGECRETYPVMSRNCNGTTFSRYPHVNVNDWCDGFKPKKEDEVSK